MTLKKTYQLEWSYMYETLNTFSFGKAFVDWIQILFTYLLLSQTYYYLLVTLKTPSNMEVFGHISSLSGFKTNQEKSELISVHLNYNSTSQRSVPFRITKDRFTYLGMSVTRKPGLLLEANQNLKINELKKNTEFQNTPRRVKNE